MDYEFGTALANMKMGSLISRASWNSLYWLTHKDGKTFQGNEYGMIEIRTLETQDILADDWIINYDPDQTIREPEIKVNLLGMPKFGVSDDATS